MCYTLWVNLNQVVASLPRNSCAYRAASESLGASPSTRSSLLAFRVCAEQRTTTLHFPLCCSPSLHSLQLLCPSKKNLKNATDDHLLYLDPHYCQPTVDITKENFPLEVNNAIVPLPILFNAASSFLICGPDCLLVFNAAAKPAQALVWEAQPKCWSGVRYYRSYSDCILSLFFPLCTTCSRFTVNTPGRCPSLAWTPVAPSASMLKDNLNLNLCAQKFSRFVNVLARSYKISAFFPLFFILKVGMNADLHVAVSFSPRLCLPLQRGTPCLSLKREKVERRRRAAGLQQTSPTSRGIWNSQVKTMLTTAWMSLFCYEQKSMTPPQRGQQLQRVTDECATVAFAGCTNRQCLQKQQRSQRTLQVAFLGFGAAIYSPVINDFYTDASRDEWNLIF